MSVLSDHDRHTDLSRAIQICRLIALEALTLAQLAERLSCHPRTIRRAIYMLQSAGVDIMSATSTQDDGDDLGEPFGRTLEPAKIYKLDRRAWSGLLHLPVDGSAVSVPAANGGAR